MGGGRKANGRRDKQQAFKIPQQRFISLSNCANGELKMSVERERVVFKREQFSIRGMQKEMRFCFACFPLSYLVLLQGDAEVRNLFIKV